MLSALDASIKTCRRTHTASSPTRSASGTPSHPFTAVRTPQQLPIACRLTVRRYFLSTSSLMASDTMCRRQWVGTNPRLSKSSSRVCLRSLPMENSSKYSSSVKISDKQTVRCGWRVCAGSHHGMESAIVSGTPCELPFLNKLLRPDQYIPFFQPSC
jgi:hypothetical protein